MVRLLPAGWALRATSTPTVAAEGMALGVVLLICDQRRLGWASGSAEPRHCSRVGSSESGLQRRGKQIVVSCLEWIAEVGHQKVEVLWLETQILVRGWVSACLTAENRLAQCCHRGWTCLPRPVELLSLLKRRLPCTSKPLSSSRQRRQNCPICTGSRLDRVPFVFVLQKRTRRSCLILKGREGTFGVRAEPCMQDFRRKLSVALRPSSRHLYSSCCP
jgi:hypothetical protein